MVRDVATAAALATGCAALTFESFRFGGLGYWGVISQLLGDHWKFWDGILGIVFAVGMMGIHVVIDALLLVMVSFLLSNETDISPVLPQ